MDVFHLQRVEKSFLSFQNTSKKSEEAEDDLLPPGTAKTNIPGPPPGLPPGVIPPGPPAGLPPGLPPGPPAGLPPGMKI